MTKPTDWVSNLVVAEKPNGKLRVCIDPQHLNKALKRSNYPLPIIEAILPDLVDVKVFSKVDVKEGYLQIVLDDESTEHYHLSHTVGTNEISLHDIRNQTHQ